MAVSDQVCRSQIGLRLVFDRSPIIIIFSWTQKKPNTILSVHTKTILSRVQWDPYWWHYWLKDKIIFNPFFWNSLKYIHPSSSSSILKTPLTSSFFILKPRSEDIKTLHILINRPKTIKRTKRIKTFFFVSGWLNIKQVEKNTEYESQ